MNLQVKWPAAVVGARHARNVRQEEDAAFESEGGGGVGGADCRARSHIQVRSLSGGLVSSPKEG